MLVLSGLGIIALFVDLVALVALSALLLRLRFAAERRARSKLVLAFFHPYWFLSLSYIPSRARIKFLYNILSFLIWLMRLLFFIRFD